jgi:hypothetical protein
LVYSTYLGGSGGAYGYAITVDGAGDAYVTGTAYSGFPTTANAIQSSLGSATRDAYVTELNASGSKLLFSTYLGGTKGPFGVGDQAMGIGIALDSQGSIYLTGLYKVNNSGVADFPTTAGAFQTTYGGGIDDAFVAKITLP